MTNRIEAQITANSTGFKRGLDDASRSAQRFSSRIEKQFSGLSRGFAALAGIAGANALAGNLNQIARAALDAGGALADASKATGIAAGALQEYRSAAKLAGVEQATLDAALGVFARNLGDARRGNDALADTFRKVGVSATDTATGALDKAFNALASITDQSIRASVASDLFGRSGVRLSALVADGAESFNAARKQARDLGLVLSDELVRSADAAGDRLDILDAQLKTQLQTTVLENIDGFLAFKTQMNEIARGAVRLAAGIGDAAVSFTNFFAAVSGAGLSKDSSLSQLIKERETLQREIKDAAEGAARGRGIAEAAPLTFGIANSIADARQKKAGELSQQLRLVETAIAEARSAQEALRSTVAATGDGDGGGGFGAGGAGAGLRNRFPGLDGPTLKTDALARNLESAQQRIAEIAGTLSTPLDELRAQLSEIDRLRPFAENAIDAGALDAAAAGLRERMKELQSETSIWGTTIEDATRSLADGFANAIVRGESLLGTLKRLVAQLAVRALSNFLFRSIGNALGIPSLPGLASGGPALAGRAYLVGERGPEIFTPSVSGTVIPNGASLGGGVMVTQNIRFDVGLESVSERIATMTPAISASVVEAVQRAQARPRFA